MEDVENMQSAKARAATDVFYVCLGWIGAVLKVDQGFPGTMQLLNTGVGIF